MNRKGLKKLELITAVLAVMVSMVGMAAANPYDLIIKQATPNQNLDAPNPILLSPGIPQTFSLLGQHFVGPLPETFPLSASVTCAPANPSCHTADLTVVFNHVSGITNPFPSLNAVSDPTLANNSVTVTLSATPQDPLGTQFTFVVRGGPGTVDGENASATRTIYSQQPPPTPTPPPTPPCTNCSEFWQTEWFNTLPQQYTEFQIGAGHWVGQYLVTSGFVAPEAHNYIWDALTLQNGSRLKYWNNNTDGLGDLYVHTNGSNNTLRLYGTFDEGPGNLTAKDPDTNLAQENPGYTDPISPFFPQGAQAPRKDFVTFNPAIMRHNFGYNELVFNINGAPIVEEAQEKVFKRMWYEKQWFKDDNKNGKWDVIVVNKTDSYVATIDASTFQAYFDANIPTSVKQGWHIRESNNPLTANPGTPESLADTYGPAIEQEFTYMTLDATTNPVAVQNGSQIMIPMASYGGAGLNSFESVLGQGPDYVTVESEQTLGMDIDGSGMRPMEPDNVEVNGDESVVLVSPQKFLVPGQSMQWFDNVVTLQAIANTNPAGINFNVCDNEGGVPTCANNQVLSVGQVLEYQRGVLSSKGPFYIKLVAVNTNSGTATIQVGRLFGRTLANIGANQYWNEKAFMVQGVLYDVVAIKAEQDNLFKYITFREKLPKTPIKLYGKDLIVWGPNTPLPEMPPFNIAGHEIMPDVQSAWSWPVQKVPVIGPITAPPLVISYVNESIEPRFTGELKEIYTQNESWETEWINTIPKQYTEFVLPIAPSPGNLYLVTSGFVAPEAHNYVWDALTLQNGSRLKFWFDPTIGNGLFVNNSNGDVRLYGTFDEGPGDLNAKDPDTGLAQENPGYTDPTSPFFPQAPQAPRKDFITFNPAIMQHNDGYNNLLYYINGSPIVQEPQEKAFKRMWYEKQWFKDDNKNGIWDVIVQDSSGKYVATIDESTWQAYFDANIPTSVTQGWNIREYNNPLKAAPGTPESLADTYGPAIDQEVTYMTLDSTTNPIAVQSDSQIMIPMANNASLGTYGLNSFESVAGQGPDYVKIESAQTLGMNIDGTGMKSMNPDGIELSGDESVVLVSPQKFLIAGQSMQWFDNVVTLQSVNTNPPGINFKVCDNEGGVQTCTPTQVLSVGNVLEYQRGTLSSSGPFYVKLVAVNTNTGTATIEVGRLFGRTLANIGANQYWNEKAFMVQGVLYDVVAIKTEQGNTFKYITFREKLPKTPIKLYGKDLHVWPATVDLPEMPPFNTPHDIMQDVQTNWTYPIQKVGPELTVGPLEVSWTSEANETRFVGELKEIYAENLTTTPQGWPGDINGDGCVTFDDFVLFGNAYGTSIGNPNYNPLADLNNDGKVDFNDFVLFGNVYGTCKP